LGVYLGTAHLCSCIASLSQLPELSVCVPRVVPKDTNFRKIKTSFVCLLSMQVNSGRPRLSRPSAAAAVSGRKVGSSRHQQS
jgi:hypothetical protein